MASVVYYNLTSNSVGVYLTGLDTSYSRADRYVFWNTYNTSDTTGANTYHGMYALSAYASEGGHATLTGLMPNTTYRIEATVTYTDGVGGNFVIFLENYVTTLSARPSAFWWYYTKESGGDFNLTAAEWNNLMANINAVRSYKGYYAVLYTVAYTGDDFTAAIYNEAAAAINQLYYSLYGTMPISTVSSGDAITADCLNDLQYYINLIQ